MANLLKGKEVADAINAKSKQEVETLKEKGIIPTLAILRVGEKENDLSYERGTIKRCQEVGVKVIVNALQENVTKEEFYNKLNELNNDSNIHAILVFRPLPKELDNELARNSVLAIKDVDGSSDASLSGVFTNSNVGYAPCTAQAAMEILNYYNIDVKGKNVVVIGRSLVVGKPLSMLLLNSNATVTICHTKTVNIKEITKKADIVIAATGQMESLNKDYFNEKQTIIDVGISWNANKNKLCGDVLFEDVEPNVLNITPVPGGVGSVTTSVLVSHVVEACKKQIN